MFKFLVKAVILLLAIQAGMGYLRKEEMISGEIVINYPVVKEKIMKLIPTDLIADKLQAFVSSKVKEALASKLDDWQTDLTKTANQSFVEHTDRRIVVHVISEGETLSEISQVYRVPWQVIKKVNQISDERELYVGQHIRIPSLMRNVT